MRTLQGPTLREVGQAAVKVGVSPHRKNGTNCLQSEQMRDDAEAGSASSEGYRRGCWGLARSYSVTLISK